MGEIQRKGWGMILVEPSLGARGGALVAAVQRQTGGVFFVFQKANRFSMMASSQVLVLFDSTLGLWIETSNDKGQRAYQWGPENTLPELVTISTRGFAESGNDSNVDPFHKKQIWFQNIRLQGFHNSISGNNLLQKRN